MRTATVAIVAAILVVPGTFSARADQAVSSATPVPPTTSDGVVTDALAAAERALNLQGEAYKTNSIDAFRVAADALERAVWLNPDDLVLRKSLAFVALEKLGDPQRAYAHTEYVVKHAQEDVGWTKMLAKAAIATGRKDHALTIYTDLVQKQQADVWDRLALAKLLIDKDRHDQVGPVYVEALRVEPNNEYANIAYAEWHRLRGHHRWAEQLARRVLERNPTSAGAHSLLGDLYRTNGDLTRAKGHYDAALASDARYSSALAGLKEIRKSRATKITSSPNAFRDTNGLDQSGIFNTVSIPIGDKVLLDPLFNRRWFTNAKLGVARIERFESGFNFGYRFNQAVSVGGGAFAFHTQGRRAETGINGHISWVPITALYAYLYGRTNDPVNESISTIQRNFTQDIVGGTVALQMTSRWSSTMTGSVAEYSDDNQRRYLNAETAYRIVNDPPTHLRMQYEVFDYERRAQEYPSPEWYQYLRPALDIAPRINEWLTLQTKMEVPYAIAEVKWGTGITAGAIVKLLDDRLEVSASYLRYELPGAFWNYSGAGFKAGLTYQF